MFVWTSGQQQGQGAAVPFSSSTACEKNEKTENQSKYKRAHRSCEFNFWTLGISNICHMLCSQPSSGNCNLFVLMLFPPGPAFIISYIWFSILSSPMPYFIITIILFFCWAFLTSWLGLWDVPCFWLQVFANGCGGWKSRVKFLRKVSGVTKHETLFSTFWITFGLEC